MQRIYGSFPKRRDPFASFCDGNEFVYFGLLAVCANRPVDLDRKSVCFPLHLQSEMMASSFGGPYRDQVLSIEEVSRSLPPDGLIYVKENTKQDGYARDPMFFPRIKRIPNVRFLSSQANTHKLIRRAQFIAFIAGWKAIKKGKPAMICSHTWFQRLPGIFKFSPDLDPMAVAEAVIDHSELEQATGNLVARGYEGLVFRGWQKALADFDPVKIADCMARAALGLLRGDI